MKKRLYPLRRVVGTVAHPHYKTVYLDLLECGHTLSQARDIYGPRCPARRRCRFCFGAGSGKKCEITEAQGEPAVK